MAAGSDNGGTAGNPNPTAGGGGVAAGSGGASAGSDTGGTPSGGSGGGTAGDSPAALVTLTPSGTCPEFQQGLLTFNPSTGPRDVEVLMDGNAMTKEGPIVFGWHATDGNPNQAIGWFGAEQIAELTAMGGILIAPYREPNVSTRPWYYTPEGPGDADNDMLLMDEVVACAIEKVGIDQRHIHAYGMSAGGLMTVQVSYRRSSYVASVVVYSGGQVGDVPNQDPTNKFAAMVVHGGETDVSSVDGITYQPASETYVANLKAAGHFAFLCNHDSGHTDPAVLADADQAHASAWQFLQDHPFGAASPYAAALPQGFWADCSLQ
jgi:poly(3-hydroxybutyrate) depolymerase